jgi:Fic family protein
MDIFLDIALDRLPDHTFRVETDRFGPFVFKVGVDMSEVAPLLARVEDAHGFFRDSPLSQAANRLEKEVLVSSIYGTNTIEGGRLTEQETARILEEDPAKVKEEEARRVANIKRAYDLAQKAALDPAWQLDVDFIRQLHAAITEGLSSVESRNQPGVLRDNPKTVVTEVGSAETGGRYKPPQSGRDVARLLAALVEWHAELQQRGVPALIRAPLFHLHFELIHPFWDGNGRVGRVLEATLLLAAGYRYAPFALARFYLDEIHRYFALFNTCRRKAGKGDAHPNTDFVVFHLEGMLATIKRLHHRVNRIIGVLLFANSVKRMSDTKEINARQYAIVSHVLDAGDPMPLEELLRTPWYLALYAKRNDKTRRRDLSALREKGVLVLDKNGRLWPGFVALDDKADPDE